MKGFVIALQFLTRLPMPAVGKADADDFAAAIRWFPFAGLFIGLAVAGAGWAGGRIDPWTGALAALIAWVAITGALHLDGLGDLADGVGAAHRDRAKLLAVMADPHIGSFGVVAITLLLAAKLVLLRAAIDAEYWAALILIPMAARIGPLAWARWLEPLHHGLGARFSDAVRGRDLIGWSAVLLGTSVLVPALLAAPLLIALFGLWLQARLGGVTGDCHGAGIELVEAGLLLALAVTATL